MWRILHLDSRNLLETSSLVILAVGNQDLMLNGSTQRDLYCWQIQN
uniref:Uncharacterized protein n=1 Tax=Populus trichocarpa TaxID=3694 RepID=A0A3N7F5U3_POPTR